jgi:hypothetical protein
MMFARGDTAWLGIGGTLTTHRRCRVRDAIMAKHIRDAAASRCDWVMTETDEDAPMRPNSSFHNMTRTGFLLAQQQRNNVFKTRRVAEKYVPHGTFHSREHRVRQSKRNPDPPTSHFCNANQQAALCFTHLMLRDFKRSITTKSVCTHANTAGFARVEAPGLKLRKELSFNCVEHGGLRLHVQTGRQSGNAEVWHNRASTEVGKAMLYSRPVCRLGRVTNPRERHPGRGA